MAFDFGRILKIENRTMIERILGRHIKVKAPVKRPESENEVLVGVVAGKQHPFVQALVKEFTAAHGLAGIARGDEEKDHVRAESDPAVMTVFDLFKEGLDLGFLNRFFGLNAKREGRCCRDAKEEKEDPPSH